MTENEIREMEIEELQRAIPEDFDSDPWRLRLFYHHRIQIATLLYDLGYRKINDGDVIITVKGEMRQRGALARLVNFATNRARKTVATTMFKDVLALLAYAEKVGMRGAMLQAHVKDIAERNGANIDGYNL